MITGHEASQLIRRRIRIEFGNQKQAADQLGIPYKTLNAMLTGRRSVDSRLGAWMGWKAERVTVYREN